MTDEMQTESLKDEMTNIVEEARMVIPGAQALFGFQTLAVFNNRFDDLPDNGKVVYLIALGLLTLAIALFMTPAAYHRLAEPGQVSRRIISLSSRAITLGMVPLLLAFSIDIYVVVVVGTENPVVGLVAAVATMICLVSLWFGFPLVNRWLR
jgi:hypothetical protein